MVLETLEKREKDNKQKKIPSICSFSMSKRLKFLHIRRTTFYIFAVVVFLADQLSKYFIVTQFSPGESFPLIPGVIHFTFVKNFGAAFGILPNQRLFFIIVSLLIIILIITGEHLICREFPHSRTGLSLLLGGALGNFWDRLFSGYVIDFVDLRFWPVFNIADIAIVLGVILLFLTLNLVFTNLRETKG